MRLFVLDNGLRSRTGHHFTVALGLRLELERRGIDGRFYAHEHASSEVIDALEARRVFAFTPYDRVSRQPVWGVVEDLFVVGRAFGRACSALIDDGLCQDDIVLVPTALQNELHGCSLWLRSLPRDRRPTLVLNFMVENFLRAGTNRLGGIALLYRFAMKRLAKQVQPHKLIMTANSRGMAGRLTRLLAVQGSVRPRPTSRFSPEDQLGLQRTPRATVACRYSPGPG